MSTVNIVMGFRGDQPLMRTDPRVHESITSSGTSQSTTGVAAASEICEITTDGNVWVKFGSAPTAAAGADFLVLSGQTRYWDLAVGDKVAVIDA